jgi:putative endonuclease
MAVGRMSLAVSIPSGTVALAHGHAAGKTNKYRFAQPARRRERGGRIPAGEVDGAGDPRRPLGRRGEDQVLAHFQRLGFELVACNQHRRFAELDLVVFDGHTLVFVEVKTRHTREQACGFQRYDGSLGWPSVRQAQGLRNAARSWLTEQGPRRPRASEIRFDVVRVLLDREERLVSLDHLQAVWEGLR